jgi:hypothetical protein
MSVCLTGMHLIGVYLERTSNGRVPHERHLTGVHLMGVYLTGIHLIYESSLRAGHEW